MIDADLTSHYIEGLAVHGDTPFRVPLLSEVGEFQSGTLYHGGFGPIDPSALGIDTIISMYPWERYDGEYRIHAEFRMYDASGQVPEGLLRAATKTLSMALGLGHNVLVHCQAGLNRSSLVVGSYLINHEGMEPDAAIKLIRERRSDACLCNEDFEEYLRASA